MTARRSARVCRPGHHRSTPEKATRGVRLALLLVVLGVVAPAAVGQVEGLPPPPDSVRPTAAPPVRGPSPRPAVGERAPVDPPSPAVAIRVRVPAEVAAGKELTYRLIAENTSRGSAHHVEVRATLPPGAARFVRATPEPAESSPALLWKLGTLRGCEKREITLVVSPTGAEEIALCARVKFEHGQCVRTRVSKSGSAAPPPTAAPPTAAAKPALQLRSFGPAEALLYDIVGYKLEVRNLGRATARNVVVRDVLPKGANLSTSKPAEKSQDPTVWELGDLAPGRAAIIEYNVVFKQPGLLTNRATVTATGAEPGEASHTIRVGQPALKVSITGPKQRLVGRPTTYHLTVSNPGDGPATNVQLTDQLVAPKLKKETIELKEGMLEFLSASDGGRLEQGNARWNLGTLAAGEARTVKLVIRPRLAGQFENVCFVTADRGLDDQAKTVTTFAHPAGLAVEIEPERDPVEVDQASNVLVRVHNPGPANDDNVAAVITLPEGLKFLGLPGVTGHEVKGRTILLPRRALGAGQDAQVILRVQPEKPGPMKIDVELSSAGLGAGKSLKADETFTVRSPATTSRKASW